MTKTFHYLAGLPRSGNTLLAALLNQHPDIFASPISPVVEILYRNTEVISYEESCIRTIDNKVRYNSLIRNILPNFYKDIEKPVIIDRNRTWGTPYNLDLLKRYINPNPKIIFTVRDIPEILASFLKLNPDAYKREVENSQYYRSRFMPYEDVLCDHLMRMNGEIDKCLLSISMMLLPENKDNIFLIEYNDLINDTQRVMSDVYSFLGLEDYTNNLSNIKKKEKDLDTLLGFNANLHEIRPSISKSNTDAKAILSDYAYNKYSGMEFWRENSALKIKGQNII